MATELLEEIKRRREQARADLAFYSILYDQLQAHTEYLPLTIDQYDTAEEEEAESDEDIISIASDETPEQRTSSSKAVNSPPTTTKPSRKVPGSQKTQVERTTELLRQIKIDQEQLKAQEAEVQRTLRRIRQKEIQDAKQQAKQWAQRRRESANKK